MLWYRQDQKSDKDGEVDIGGDDFRIEIVGLDDMDDADHREHPEYCPESRESIGDDDYRDSRDDRAEYRDKSKYKNNQRKRDNIGKVGSCMHETDDDESDRREHRIHEGDDRLSSEYHPESCADLSGDDRVLFIEKCEIPITHLS